MTIREVIGKIRDDCDWKLDVGASDTNLPLPRRVYTHPQKPGSIVLDGHLDTILSDASAGSIVTRACDD